MNNILLANSRVKTIALCMVLWQNSCTYALWFDFCSDHTSCYISLMLLWFGAATILTATFLPMQVRVHSYFELCAILWLGIHSYFELCAILWLGIHSYFELCAILWLGIHSYFEFCAILWLVIHSYFEFCAILWLGRLLFFTCAFLLSSVGRCFNCGAAFASRTVFLFLPY